MDIFFDFVELEFSNAHTASMVRKHIINANWDAEAGVWVATSDDVPGLVTEAKTFEGLLKKIRTIVQEMMELNGAMPKSGVQSW